MGSYEMSKIWGLIIGVGMVCALIAGAIAGISGEYERATMNYAVAIFNLMLLKSGLL